MKDIAIKIILLGIIGVFESLVGLPVLLFALFLVWQKDNLKDLLLWQIVVSLMVSVLWGMSWWLSFLMMFLISWFYDYLQNHVQNKLLRLIVILGPSLLIFAEFISIEFYWRIVFYSLVSVVILFIFQKYLLSSYEKKYL